MLHLNFDIKPHILSSQIQVLVVDDNAINRMVTSKLLRTLGCEATVLESGPECIQKLAEVGPSGFDIVLLDLCMPEVIIHIRFFLKIVRIIF